MSHFISEPPAPAAPREVVFVGTSQWRFYFPFVFGVLVSGALALELGLGTRSAAILGVSPDEAKVTAATIGGVVAFAILVLAWMWFGRLRWVAVGADGVRWSRRWRVHSRGWGEFAGVKRTAVELYTTSEKVKPALGAELHFYSGKPLPIHPETVADYDGLIASIEEAARGRAGLGGSSSHGGSSWDRRLPGWAGQFGQPRDEVQAFGPLKLRPDGVQWAKMFRSWDDIKSYEVSHGYLVIQAADGSEFLKRLIELGDWQLVLDRLDEVIGEKRVGGVAAAEAEKE